jgi:hypothetical protein
MLEKGLFFFSLLSSPFAALVRALHVHVPLLLETPCYVGDPCKFGMWKMGVGWSWSKYVLSMKRCKKTISRITCA